VQEGEPGSVRWKDMFYDYVWDSNSIKNVRGEIVAIPVLLSAGAQTGIFYNADIFEEEDVAIPETWQEFTDLIFDLDEAGVRPFQPYSGYTKPGLYQWAMEFSLTPNVLKWMTETDGEFNIDYDGDGKLTSLEVLRGGKEGKFDPTKEGPARAVYEVAYNYYADCLGGPCKGWGNYEYKTKWDAGELAMWDNGIWQIPMEESNVARKFDYGVFLTPIADDTTDGLEEYCAETEYYDDFDDVVCPVSVAFNVMKPAVKNNPKKLEQAIDFLMYLTAKENVSAMAREKGGTKGAIKGSDYNTLIDDIGWKDQQFPVISYSAAWPTGYTSEQSSIINKSFERWVRESKFDDNDFFSALKTAQLTGANAFISKFNIDTSDWDI
jgi:ABC-type glycerol-3-phosphate transport system substrate-binding protein